MFGTARARAVLLGATLLAGAVATGTSAPTVAQPATEGESEEVLPAGEGRAETFGYCVACHSSAIIRRSGFSRERWDGLMDWMTQTHGMAPLEGELRVRIVDYLAAAFPPRATPRRTESPFLR